MQNDQLIIGLGTGRCGTVSLSVLLNQQNDCIASHELLGADTWGQNFDIINSKIKRRFNNSTFVADVASYNLPYVEKFIESHTSVKFIILKSDKNDTVESFMHKTVNKNHWQTHDGRKYIHDPWDNAHPKFNAKNKQHALELYWDMYYDSCNKISRDRCFHINTIDLNNESTCIEMLKWCGFTKPCYKLIHTNERG